MTNSGKISRLKSVTVFTGKSDVIANTQHNVFIRVLHVSSAGVVSVVSVLGATSLKRYKLYLQCENKRFDPIRRHICDEKLTCAYNVL